MAKQHEIKTPGTYTMLEGVQPPHRTEMEALIEVLRKLEGLPDTGQTRAQRGYAIVNALELAADLGCYVELRYGNGPKRILVVAGAEHAVEFLMAREDT